MSISGITSNNPASSSLPASSAGSTPASFADDAISNFQSYMKESPAERMVDAWLKQHGLTKEKLAAMPPDQQKAVMKQMAKDIADEIKQAAADKKKGITTDISA